MYVFIHIPLEAHCDLSNPPEQVFAALVQCRAEVPYEILEMFQG